MDDGWQTVFMISLTLQEIWWGSPSKTSPSPPQAFLASLMCFGGLKVNIYEKCSTQKCHFLGIFMTNLKMLGGAIRDLVFENVVIGGEKIETQDHFYTNEFVFDLQFS